jgi:hypothetical protein
VRTVKILLRPGRLLVRISSRSKSSFDSACRPSSPRLLPACLGSPLGHRHAKVSVRTTRSCSSSHPESGRVCCQHADFHLSQEPSSFHGRQSRRRMALSEAGEQICSRLNGGHAALATSILPLRSRPYEAAVHVGFCLNFLHALRGPSSALRAPSPRKRGEGRSKHSRDPSSSVPPSRAPPARAGAGRVAACSPRRRRRGRSSGTRCRRNG